MILQNDVFAEKTLFLCKLLVWVVEKNSKILKNLNLQNLSVTWYHSCVLSVIQQVLVLNAYPAYLIAWNLLCTLQAGYWTLFFFCLHDVQLRFFWGKSSFRSTVID